MSRFVRASKVRHVFCEPSKETYTDFRLSSATGDHNYIKANSKFFALPIQSGGGSLAVIGTDKFGKMPPQYPMLTGHKSNVLDFDFNPFHDNVIASGSEDCHCMVWGIPEGGLTENVHTPLLDLQGHQRKVSIVKFHPTMSNVLTTASSDYTVKLWDIERGDEKVNIKAHDQLINDVAWSYDGNVLATSCKDKHLRLLDPRTGAETAKVQAHEGSKTFKLVWLGPREKLVSVGFTRQSKRHFRVWDPRNMSKEVCNMDIDQAAGVIMPFYDEDTNLLYLAGKGDGNIRYFEMVDDTPWAFSISEHRTSKSAKGMCMLDKRSCDVMRCEVARFMKLTSRDVEPLSFIIPRKSELFQDDIFPDCRSGKASGTATEFFDGGISKKPILMSLDPAKRESGASSSSAEPAFKVLKSASDLQKELDAANKKIAELEAKLKAAGIN